MRTGEPYPVKALLAFGNNTLVSCANSRQVHESLMKLDFLLAMDLYRTPTAELADILLPAASWLELDELFGVPFVSPFVALAQQKIVRTGECRSDRRGLHRAGEAAEPRRWNRIAGRHLQAAAGGDRDLPRGIRGDHLRSDQGVGGRYRFPSATGSMSNGDFPPDRARSSSPPATWRRSDTTHYHSMRNHPKALSALPTSPESSRWS